MSTPSVSPRREAKPSSVRPVAIRCTSASTTTWVLRKNNCSSGVSCVSSRPCAPFSHDSLISAGARLEQCVRCNDAPDIVAILLASAKAAFDGALKSVGTRIRVKIAVHDPSSSRWRAHPVPAVTVAINKIAVARLRESGDIQQWREISPIEILLDGRHDLESTKYVASESAPGLKRGSRMIRIALAALVTVVAAGPLFAQTPEAKTGQTRRNSPTPTLALESLTGRDSFDRYCASCHGAAGRGGGPVGSVLRNRPTI